MENKSENKETFESAYKKLEAIVNKMETESLDLETALKAFEDGRKTVDQCQKMLENAELKLKDLRNAQAADQD